MRKLASVLLLAVVLSPPLLARSLHWSSLSVDARLDRDGRMHVRETQTIVFDGDWNGGERRFSVRPGQTLDLLGVTRIAEDGTELKLGAGDVDKVDRYSLFDGSVLRWRSRLPEDPPFENKAITYRIDYTLAGILRHVDDRYVLAHDFAFPDRAGVIEQYALNFVLDPAWGGSENPVFITHRNLIPGEGVVVRRDLTFRGEGAPATAVAALSPGVATAIAGLFAAAMAALLFLFLREEWQRGRFARLVDPDAIDERWLEEHVTKFPPEVAGAAWDGKIGPSEVAAVLARMTSEKKIESRVEKGGFFRRPVLHLKLLVKRDSLRDHELDLVRALFFAGRTETDTKSIRKHYSSRGLDLGAIIRPDLEHTLRSLGRWNEGRKRANVKQNALAVVIALALLITTGVIYRGENGGVVAGFVLLGIISFTISSLAAWANRQALTALPLRFTLVLLPVGLAALAAFSAIRSSGETTMKVPVLIMIAAWIAILFKIVLDLLKTDEAPERIEFRRRFASARRYFRRQLRSRAPQLRDEWLPYLLAFGLGKNVDRWFSRYAEESSSLRSSSMTSRSESFGSSSGSGGGWSFSGGGGAFGGAGATGAWTVAAGALAAGVSAPGSGSSGGGGSSSSSSGGSSGGGGGGGW